MQTTVWRKMAMAYETLKIQYTNFWLNTLWFGYTLPVKVRVQTTRDINTIENERARNGKEEGCWKKCVCQWDQECVIHYRIIQEYDISCRCHLGFKFKPIPLMPCYIVMVTNKGG